MLRLKRPITQLHAKPKTSNPDFDLDLVTSNLSTRPIVRNIGRRNRRLMNRIVDKVILTCLQERIDDIRNENPEIEADEIVRRLFAIRTTLLGESAIHVISELLKALGARTYCAESTIRDYIVREFDSRNRTQYGIRAIISDNDVLIVKDFEITPREAQQTVSDI